MIQSKVRDWEKSAMRTGILASIFVLIALLIVDGIHWLISGAKPTKDEFAFIVAVFFVAYFNESINSLHERLSEIASSIKSADLARK